MPGIVGIITSNPNGDEGRSQLSTMMRCMLHEPRYAHGTYVHPRRGWYFGWVNHPNSFSDCNPIVNITCDRVLIFSGEHFSHQEISAPRGGRHGSERLDGSHLLSQYEKKGENFLVDLNGWFAGILIDLRKKTVLLFNDRFGVHRLHYHQNKDSFAFASEAKALLSIRPETRALDSRSLGEFVGCGAVFENRTLFSDISTLPGGSSWTFRGPSDIRKRRYFDVAAWEQQPALSEEAFFARLKTTMSRILPAYFRARTGVGVSLTGGLDTRIVMAGMPAAAQPAACYTYGGVYRDCFDVDVAKAVARACSQTHQVVPLGADFFENFATFAEDTIWVTDGCLDICGSHEVYLSRRAGELAPIRLTGNYGSEVLRSVSTLKYFAPAEGLFDRGLDPSLKEALASFSEIKTTHPVTLAAFKEIPWNLYGRLAAAESQLTLRSPYMDNELVSLVYQAPPEVRKSNELSLRLIAALNPKLATIGTDMGYGGNGSRLLASPQQLYRYLLFKAEWYYNAGMPHRMARLDGNRWLRPFNRFFLGSHKIDHYRLWFRDQLFDYIQSVLNDQSTATRPYVNRSSLRQLVTAHRKGTGNFMNEINKLVTLELVQRLLVEGPNRNTTTAEMHEYAGVGNIGSIAWLGSNQATA